MPTDVHPPSLAKLVRLTNRTLGFTSVASIPPAAVAPFPPVSDWNATLIKLIISYSAYKRTTA